jgi:hypothetical protein
MVKAAANSLEGMMKNIGIGPALTRVGTTLTRHTENETTQIQTQTNINDVIDSDDDDIVSRTEPYIRFLAMAICIATGDKLDSIFTY